MTWSERWAARCRPTSGQRIDTDRAPTRRIWGFGGRTGGNVHSKSRKTKVLAALSVIALVAVASCGDDDDTSNATTTPGTVATGSTPDTEAAGDTTTTKGDSTETTEGGTDTTEGGTETTEATGDTLPGLRVAKDEGEPVKGGTLTYALEADSANGWAPYRVSCATSCYVNLEAGVRLTARAHRRQRDRPAARRVGRPQRRLHRVDDEDPRGHQVPRRHAARRCGGEVQRRDVHVQPR